MSLCGKPLSCNLVILTFLNLFENGNSILEGAVNDYCLIPNISNYLDTEKHLLVLV